MTYDETMFTSAIQEPPAETQPADDGVLAMNAEEVLATYAKLAGAHQRARDEVLASVREALEDIDAEFKPAMDAARETVEQYVLASGKSVKAGGLHAIVMAGRTSWDTKALDGYAVAHPEVLKFRKTGNPSVTIRNAK